MRISNYSIFVENYPNPGQHLVYHTRTQALVKIKQRLKDLLDRIQDDGGGGLYVEKEERQHLEALYRMGVIVRDEAEDRAKLDRFMEQKKYGVNDAYFMATILTTYNCNFACTYCFEESTRTSSQKLDFPTSDKIISWLKHKVERLRVKRLELNYYGGEPLLNQPVMEYISAEMKLWCGKRGIGFQMAMQTNGALLTPECVEKFLPLGLISAQVSLDGVREVHDRQRPMRGSGSGTFDAVIKNLLAVADRIKIVVAAGYDKGNPEPMVELIEYLDSIGLLRKLRKFTYSPIHPTLGPKGHPEKIVAPECMSNYETDPLMTADARIKEIMQRKGLETKSGLAASMCPVTTGDNGVTIDTNGLIFKCNAMLGHPDLAVGNIHEEEYNQRDRYFKSATPWKECGTDCPYAPLCNTGCRLFSFFKKGDFLAKSCERSYMDRFVPEAIKKEYENQLKKKAEAVAISTS